MSVPEISAQGDSCLSVRFAAAIDSDINARCVALASALEQLRLEGVRDVVPAFHTVSVFFDPLRSDRAALTGHVERAIRQSIASTTAQVEEPRQISVMYGGADGPDLAAVAEFAGVSEREVVRVHVEATYRVYMLGFLPGFAYLGTVDPRIAMPRLDSPRLRVPAGSVGIAGAQTGIYPRESPGGWRIIGRTAQEMFDAGRNPPSLLKAGDLVKFVPA